MERGKLGIPKELWALFLGVVSAIAGYFIPITMVLGSQEVTNPEIQLSLSFYPFLLFGGIIVAELLYFTRKIWRRDNKYGSNFGFFSIEDSPIPFIRNKTAPQLTLLSIIIFGVGFLIANSLRFLGSGLADSKFLPVQQFTPGQALAFSTLLVPISEEFLALAFIGLSILLLTFLAVRYKMSKQNYNITIFTLVPIEIGLLAVIWHSTVYKGSTVALTTVFFFWLVKTLLIILTGFFVIGWILHALNNFFLDYARIYSSTSLFAVMLTILIALGILYWYLYVYKKK